MRFARYWQTQGQGCSFRLRSGNSSLTSLQKSSFRGDSPVYV